MTAGASRCSAFPGDGRLHGGAVVAKPGLSRPPPPLPPAPPTGARCTAVPLIPANRAPWPRTRAAFPGGRFAGIRARAPATIQLLPLLLLRDTVTTAAAMPALRRRRDRTTGPGGAESPSAISPGPAPVVHRRRVRRAYTRPYCVHRAPPPPTRAHHSPGPPVRSDLPSSQSTSTTPPPPSLPSSRSYTPAIVAVSRAFPAVCACACVCAVSKYGFMSAVQFAGGARLTTIYPGRVGARR